MNNRSGTIEADLGGETYNFKIDIAGWEEIQEDCNAGPLTIARRQASGDFFFQDIRSPIKNGLIGGGMAPNEAIKKVKKYVDDRPLMENHALAMLIINAALVGAPEEEDIKKSEAVEEETNPHR